MSVSAQKKATIYFKEARDVLKAYLNTESDKEEKCQEVWQDPQVKTLNGIFPAVVSIMDLASGKCVYMSNNVTEILGHPAQFFLSERHDKILTLIPSPHHDIVQSQIFPAISEFTDKYSKNEDVMNLTISYPCLMSAADGSTRWFIHKQNIIHKTAQNTPYLVLHVWSPVLETKTDLTVLFTISQRNSRGIYDVIYLKKFLPHVSNVRLTPRESEVLGLMSRGKSSKEIGQLLFISEHTVFKHRKNMLRKLDVGRTAELLRKALSYGII